jgi:type II secretory ATPase GspE/PulE/Tfp pilus assembly ATPase PilB-like protein
MTTLPGGDLLKKYAIEDPVEYNIPGVRQISIQRGVDDSEDIVRMKFMAALRSMMRMDPDVLMIGEIRDHQSASIASELNRTGHRVLTTVHGDGCVDVLSRLCSQEIAIPPDLLASKRYLSAVMYQKLIPILCPKCKLPAKDHYSNYKKSVLKDKYRLDPDTMFVINPKGCSECANPQLSIYGTAGLTAVAEVLIPNEQILQAVGQKDWSKAELAWRGQRKVGFEHSDMLGKTAFEHALYKLSQGMIDLADIESEFQPIETYEIITPIERIGDSDGI